MSNRQIDLLRYGHEKEIRTFCVNNGLRIVFEDKHQPRTDGKTIWVGKPDPLWNSEEIIKWKFSIYHEMGHNVKEMRDCFDLARDKNLNMQSFLGVSLNLVDDYRQEHYKYDEYQGKQQVMEKGRLLSTDEVYINNPMFGNSSDPKMAALETMVAWDTYLREDWQGSLSGKSEQIAEKLSEQQREWLTALKAGNYGDVLNNNPTAQDEYDLVKRILDEIFKMDSQAEEQAATNPEQGEEGEGDGGEDGNEGGKDSDSDGKGRKKARKGKQGKPGEGEQGEGMGGRIRYDDILLHKHNENDVRTGASYAPLEIDYTDYTEAGFNPRSTDKMTLVDYKKDGAHNRNEYYSQEIMQGANESGLAKQIRRLLQVYKQSINIHGQKTGRVSKRSVYRATLKDTDNFSSRIFKKKIDNNILDSSVLILTDGSGSMGGDKFTHAARTAIMLNNAISRLGMPVEVIGFSEIYTPTHAIFKAFNERLSSEQIADRFSDFADVHMGSNSDGESILWALPRLLAQQTKKKIMIVLSDGQPASYNGDAMTFTKEVVKQIEKRKDIEIYGIGIQSRAVQQIYKHNYVINNPEEIENAVLSIVKSRIIN